MFLWWLLFILLGLSPGMSLGSEFPERECCDSAPPPPPNYHTVTSSTSLATTEKPDRVGESDLMKHKTLNCLEAKKFCDEDQACLAVLKVIPLLCGPELVACSTVTVARCQAALRTLVSFAWFQPTCLCKEPTIDPICNSFRDLLFDHPCVFVHRKEIDMHPLQTIPSCETAADICTNNSWCRQRLDDFTRICTVSGDKCSSPDLESCVKAWLRVRETPLLGCTCPDTSDSECQALQTLVNKNPCIGSSFMQRASSMTNAGVTLGSSLVRPLPLSPIQPPNLPPSAMLVACSPLPDKESSFSSTSAGLKFHPHFPCSFKPFADDSSQTDPEESLRQIKHVVGTCESALQACQTQPGCQSHLENVSVNCRISDCHPKTCRESVRSLYDFLINEDANLALKIGLCICRRTGGRSDIACVNAQGLLHPECAERTDLRSISQCHRLGRECRNNKTCRYRLEYYEQACAADTLTGRCAGNHQECRKATIGLFGSPLHVNCVCKGDAFYRPSKCLSWKRLMWGNPCVVESQLTYFLSQIGPAIDIPTIADDYDNNNPSSVYETIFGGDKTGVATHTSSKPKPSNQADRNHLNQPFDGSRIFGTRNNHHQERTTFETRNNHRQERPTFETNNSHQQELPTFETSNNHQQERPTFETRNNYHREGSIFKTRGKHYQEPPTYSTANESLVFGTVNNVAPSRNNFRESGSITEARRQEGTPPAVYVTLSPGRGSVFRKKEDQGRRNVFRKKEEEKLEKVTNTPTTTWNIVFFSHFTTTPSTTTLPEKYCKITREWDQSSPRILEPEESIRIYKNNNVDCSEICECTANEETFCKVLDCTENTPCETSYAVYNHKAPAYQAQRGGCICYSGDFICMRPRNDEYSLDSGLYLLLGFSHKEEEILRPILKGGATDALYSLQTLIKRLSREMGYDCHFELHKNTSDNLVLQVISVPSRNAFMFNMTQEMRDRCRGPVEKLANMINNRHHKIHHNIHLSLFILAEVLDNTPNAQLSSSTAQGPQNLIDCSVLLIFVMLLSFQLNFNEIS